MNLAPVEHVQELKRRWPNALKQMNDFRSGRGRDLAHWPDWCWVPMAGAFSIVSHDIRKGFEDIGKVAALTAWDVTKGVYKWDAEMLNAVLSAEGSGTLPLALLYRLPEWCIYMAYPAPVCGFVGCYVHLEHDANDKRAECRLLLDAGAGYYALVAIPVHLVGDTLEECLNAMLTENDRVAAALGGIKGGSAFGKTGRDLVDMVSPHILAALYLCIKDPEVIRDDGATKPDKRREGGRKPPVPRIWSVGYRTGKMLRDARKQVEKSMPLGGSVSPHVRRAHWHSFWMGPKMGERKLEVRWMPPTFVAGENAIPSVRQIK